MLAKEVPMMQLISSILLAPSNLFLDQAYIGRKSISVAILDKTGKKAVPGQSSFEARLQRLKDTGSH